MPWTPNSPIVIPQAIADVSTTQKLALGTRIKATHETHGAGEFIYVPGCTNGALGAWVTINSDDWTTIALAADAIGPIGVMKSALSSATATFGWAQIYGKAESALCLTGVTDNALLWCTASAGRVLNTSVGGDWVNGAKAASTSTTLSCEVELNYPYTDNNSNSA